MTSIILNRSHTHAGKLFKANERLDVESGIADWLIANGIARYDRQSLSHSTSMLPQPEGDGKPSEPKITHRKESKS